MTLKAGFSLIFLSMISCSVLGQVSTDSLEKTLEFKTLEEALKAPEKVYRLNLSGQDVNIPDETWAKFTKLEFLSLKNDHLREIPQGIGFLSNLKTLDLSGNDFVSLPKSFKNLKSLEEIFLNDEKKFVLDKSIPVLKTLPSLRIMHLENDALLKLPKSFSKMTQLESLYLNNNRFLEVPAEIKRLKNLKFVDLHNNNINFNGENLHIPGVGFKIVF